MLASQVKIHAAHESTFDDLSLSDMQGAGFASRQHQEERSPDPDRALLIRARRYNCMNLWVNSRCKDLWLDGAIATTGEVSLFVP